MKRGDMLTRVTTTPLSSGVSSFSWSSLMKVIENS